MWIDEQLEMNETNANNVLVIHLWTHWSKPSIKHHESLLGLLDRYGQDSLQIISVECSLGQTTPRPSRNSEEIQNLTQKILLRTDYECPFYRAIDISGDFFNLYLQAEYWGLPCCLICINNHVVLVGNGVDDRALSALDSALL